MKVVARIKGGVGNQQYCYDAAPIENRVESLHYFLFSASPETARANLRLPDERVTELRPAVLKASFPPVGLRYYEEGIHPFAF